ncbi:MAG: glutathione ABC transporter permease GsiC, partial [Eubacterium callanderi]
MYFKWYKLKKEENSLGKYILKRLGQTLLVLFAISIIVFLLMNVLPGDPVALMLEKRADPATVE